MKHVHDHEAHDHAHEAQDYNYGASGVSRTLS